MKKTEKKKPYKSIINNTFWCFKEQLTSVPSVFIMQMLSVPINVILSYIAIYLPSLVVAEVTEGQTIKHAIMTVGLVMLIAFICNVLKKIFDNIGYGKQCFYRTKVTLKLHRKKLNMLYQTYENKEVRNLGDRADYATQMWNGNQPIQDMPRHMWSFIESIICYILFGTVISFVSPWFVPFLTLAPIVNWLCAKAYHKWEYSNRKKWTDTDKKLWYSNQLPADFAAAKDIRIYSLASWFRDIYRSLSKERMFWDKKLTFRSFLSKIADLVVILIRDGAAYALLITMTLKGEITVDKFVLYFAAISSFASWVGNLINGWTSMNGSSLKICDLREYLDYPEQDGTGEANVGDLLNDAVEIEFQNVCFRYDGAEKDTIHNLSVKIKKGEKIALVGLNGAGKTTLIKLLCGLYKPTSGTIFINGVPQEHFLRKDYYRLFSTVFQEIIISFYSIASTVSGKDEKNTDLVRVEKCIIDAGLGEKLKSLPNGIYSKFDKQLHADGIEFSGGELQKLMLARALYKDAPVLVLDEPTSALDPIAESQLYEKYNKLSQNKTSVFVSHRLASTRFCDRILYLKDGQIIEKGTHEELARSGGEYSELYEMQSCWYKEETEHENI